MRTQNQNIMHLVHLDLDVDDVEVDVKGERREM